MYALCISPQRKSTPFLISESGDADDHAMKELENKLLAIDKLTDISKLAETSIDYEELLKLRKFIKDNHPDDEDLKKTLELIDKKIKIIEDLEELLAPKDRKSNEMPNFTSDQVIELFQEAQKYLPGHNLIERIEYLFAKQKEFLDLNNRILAGDPTKCSQEELKQIKKKLEEDLLKDQNLSPYHPIYNDLLKEVNKRLQKCQEIENLIEKGKKLQETGQIIPTNDFRKMENLINEVAPFFEENEEILLKAKREFLDKENDQKMERERLLAYIAEVEQALKSRDYDSKTLENFRDVIFKIDEKFIPEVAVTKDMLRRHLLDMSRAEEFKAAVNKPDKEATRRLFRSACFILGPEDPTVVKGANLIGAKDSDFYNFQKMSVKQLTDLALNSTDRYEVQAILQEVLKRERTFEVAELIKAAEERYRYLINIDELESRIKEVDRSFIAEITSYNNPLEAVLKVVNSTLILLGEDNKKLKSWEKSKNLFGQFGFKTSIKKRINDFNPNTVNRKMVFLVDNNLKDISLQEVEIVSKPLGLLYSWCLVNTHYHRKSEAEKLEQKNAQEMTELPNSPPERPKSAKIVSRMSNRREQLEDMEDKELSERANSLVDE